jgi:hypothetical protein
MDVQAFASLFKGGGARTNLFQVEITNPVDGSQDSIIPFRAKSSSVPTWRTNEIEVPFMGRKIYFSGVRQYDTWSATIIEDSDYAVRNALEAWNNNINLNRQNTRGFSTEEDSAYKSVAKIYLYDKLGVTVREYTLFGCWPQNIGQLTLDWDNDQVHNYEVTFRFDYLEVTGGSSGNAGNPSGV